jgi:hypothetical protein
MSNLVRIFIYIIEFLFFEQFILQMRNEYCYLQLNPHWPTQVVQEN